MLETISLDTLETADSQWIHVWERFRDRYQARMKGVERRDLAEDVPDRMVEEAIEIVLEDEEAVTAWVAWMEELRAFAGRLAASNAPIYPSDLPPPPQESPRAWRRAREYYQHTVRHQLRRRARLAAIRVMELLAIAREYRAR